MDIELDYIINHPSSPDSSEDFISISSDSEDDITINSYDTQPNSSGLAFHRTNILPPPKPNMEELMSFSDEHASAPTYDIMISSRIKKSSTSDFTALLKTLMKTLDEIKQENTVVRTRMDKQDDMFKEKA
ncbi:unnamed protein product [Vicia faba]|uniref:Uncharacterized protein n=1 Tax=Vicia faba TaxID=3906 RepID=A0AAV0Z8S7_VICFA|nr:unnamed protein product [Vicia faba]